MQTGKGVVKPSGKDLLNLLTGKKTATGLAREVAAKRKGEREENERRKKEEERRKQADA